jgi:hypothetical protein
MKPSLKTRLQAYSLTAGSIVAGLGSQAQILYTDVDPDTTIDLTNALYALDLNDDNVIDFELEALSGLYSYSSYVTSFEALNVNPQGSNAVGASYFGSYPYALLFGDEIGASMNFNNYSYNILFGTVNISGYYGSYSFPLGQWPTNIDRYVGLTIELNGNTHYGWARISVEGTSSMILRDYAIELTPDEPITAGSTFSIPFDTLDAASNVVAQDLGEAGNGSDIEVSFLKAVDESTIQEYRVIAVKASQVGSFNLATATQMTGSQYLGITPTGTDIITRLSQNALDSDGDPITSNQPYRLFIYSVGTQQFNGQEVLSEPSNEVTLITPVLLDPVQNVQLFDVDDQFNEQDLEVSFNALANESGVAEYRVIIATTEQAFTFSLADAEELGNNRYTTINPSGNNITTGIGLNKRDAAGNAIMAAIPYRAFVYAVPDGTNANVGSLSAVSNEMILNPPLGNASLQGLEELKVYVQNNALHLSGVSSNAQIALFDVQGRMILQAPYTQGSTIAMEGFSHGTYMLRVQSERGFEHAKFVY